MEIKKPTLLLNEQICRQNILDMVNKAKKHKLSFRPHFKSHQSAEIGNWFKESGITGITVSSFEMAKYFADTDWNDILVALPVNILEMDSINQLAKRINLHILVESTETARTIAKQLKFETGVYLKVDTGYHRTGLNPDDQTEIVNILHIIKNSSNLKFQGILTHAGHAYYAKSKMEILKIHQHSIADLTQVKNLILDSVPECIVSIGDTPTCSVASSFQDVDEIRPGNFVFYDVMQYSIGSCRLDQIAVALACPIVAKHKSRNEIVIYGGSIHLSKESLSKGKEKINYGLVVKLNQNGWDDPIPETNVVSLSQEHGIIRTSDLVFDAFQVGDIIGILPIHSCLTANLASHYVTFDKRIITKYRFK